MGPERGDVPRATVGESTSVEIGPLELKRLIKSGEEVKLIDVREAYEYALCRIEGAELLPLGTVPNAFNDLRHAASQSKLVFYCHHGAKSLRVVNWLRQRGIAGCLSLKGGIDRWAASVEPGLYRY